MRIKHWAAQALGTWFGCGLSPVAPGTVGTLGALVPVVLCARWFGWGPLHWLAMAAVLTVPGIWAASRVAEAAGKKDPGRVVVDEVLGTWVTLAGVTALDWQRLGLAFLLFRIFDIWKPFPVRRLEKLPAGTGIVADDLAAGVYAALVLSLGEWLNR